MVAIIGIVSAFAYPNYVRHLQRARRVDAVNGLLQVAGEQEKFFLRNNRYTDSLADLGLGDAVSPNAYYALEAELTEDGGFLVTATPTGNQARDTTCASFSYDQQGRKLAEDVDGTSTTDECWR